MDVRNEKYRQVFNHFDENKDGKVSPSELQRCIIAAGGELSPADAEAAVESMDIDGDGLVGFEDFVKFVERGGEEEKASDLREAFGMYEMEYGCGFITPWSLGRMLGRLGEPRTTEECEVMISRFDLNGDGVLDFDEFMAMVA